MATFPNINGVAYDHSSCAVRIDGIIEKRVDSLNYGHGVEGINKQYGTSRQPISRTRGQYRPDEVTLVLHLAAWNELRARWGAGFMEKVFDVISEYKEDGEAFVKDTIKGCKIQHVGKETSQGGEHVTVELTLDCMYVLENGIAPMKEFKR